MKICHIIFSLATGGAETMLVDIVNEQVKTENVTLLIINNIINEGLLKKIDTNVQVIRINRIPSGKNPIPVLKINYSIFKLNPDVIHFHNANGIDLLLPCYRRKAVLTIHTTLAISSSFKKYNKLFAISNAVKQDIRQRYRLDSTVIYNGITTKDIKIKEKPEPNSIFKIVQISRLDHLVKGQHLLIKGIKQLVYDYGITNIHVDFIGEGSSLDYLKKLATDYNVNNFISFLGIKDRNYIYNHLCNYDLLVQPSINEGFGLTVAEGMTARVPVLVSDIEGPMEVIGYGQFGYYFELKIEKSITDSLKNIIDHYQSEKNKQLIENAYQRAIEKFEVAHTAFNYIKGYL